MALTADDIYEKAAGLSPTERAALAGLLLESVTSDFDESVKEAWITELKRRSLQLKSGDVKAVPADVVLEKLHKLVAKN